MKLRLLTASLALAVFLIAAAMAGTSLGSPQLDFETKTVAVCEQAGSSVYCHDEVFVTCGDEQYMLPKTTSQINCKGVTTEVPLITAFAVFDKDWKDPRIN